jgi:hypothetical protein
VQADAENGTAAFSSMRSYNRRTLHGTNQQRHLKKRTAKSIMSLPMSAPPTNDLASYTTNIRRDFAKSIAPGVAAISLTD